MHKGGAAAPVSEDKQRVFLQRLPGNFVVGTVLDWHEGAQQSAHSFCQAKLAFVVVADVLPVGQSLESLPVSAHKRVDGQFVKC